MQYTITYHSPLGEILLACDEIGLIGLWFKDQKYFADQLSGEYIICENETLEPSILTDTRRWLDIYFSGQEPDFMPKLHLTGTPFRMEVWEILCKIPYGKTITYGQIAKEMAKNRGLKSMSSQAVGGAVGHNPVSIIVPCHRVVGTDRSLIGYAGGLDKKQALLTLEKVL